MSEDFYKLSAKSISGNEVKLSEFKGQKVLIVNTASKCGFTPQYDGLQKLYTENENLVILGFPCDQFGHQEPENEDGISQFCKMNFGVTFPLFSKIEVNGPNTHPVFDFIKKELPGAIGTNIKWNFTKFLYDENGKPVKRFAPKDTPEEIATFLENN